MNGTGASRFRVIALAMVLLPIQAQKPVTDGLSRTTTVELISRGPDGASIPLSKANLYLDIWGDGHLVSLPVNRGSATLHLDQTWLCSAWDYLCQKRQYGPARLVLQSDGFAPITAYVYWPGQTRTGESAPASSAGIQFSGGRNVRIAEGTSQQVDVSFRQASTRTVRIVEENGMPAADIRLDAWLYYGATNHNGTIEGEILTKGKTDSDGRILLPNVDGELAVELYRGHYVLRNRDPVSPFRAILTSEGARAEVTTLTLHRFQGQTLRVNVINLNGSPADLTLGGCDTFCSGACCGDLAVTDSLGQLRLDNFFVEETDSLYLTDKSGTMVWRSTPSILKGATGLLTITIR